ncbi:MAG: helix-turn-helix transcriptional regulator [Proteobacteria bacterium]|nr:helix-turn-helix transcriptional regulator [Pseudomonadota bacterium]MBS0598879.1 helix-turn-helix transcriptional regulator [Pseudomonadota bacterium]
MSSIASPEDNAAFGQRLAAVRAATGLSQTRFAETLGLSLRAYANYERGEREAPVALFRALFEQHGIDPIWMLSGTEPTPQRAAARALDFDLVERIDRLIDAYLTRARKKMKPTQRARVRRALYMLSLEGSSLSATQVEHIIGVAG